MTLFVSVLHALFLLTVLLLAIPVGVFALQVMIAPTRLRKDHRLPAPRAPVALLIPAHNEAAGIGATLASLRLQLQGGDRMLVVADNCSDDTAGVARAAGAEVAERSDPMRCGKGYALAFGVRHLSDAPPPVVIVIDADCLLEPGAIDVLTRNCTRRQRPVQAAYLMRAREGASPAKKVAEFAWTVKNLLRPLGWARLGLGCQLSGSGMAFPWSLLRVAPLANAELAEDLKLGLDCALAGQAPLFCAHAVVTSMFAENAQGERAQRTRWEHGHLALLVRYGPRLLGLGLLRRDPKLFSLAIDLCVPPLSLLLMLVVGAASAGALLCVLGTDLLPWALALPLPPLLFGALWVAWIKVGRQTLPAHQLGHALLYVLAKIPLYIRFLVRRQVAWVASARDKS